jgi:hypothetical protein
MHRAALNGLKMEGNKLSAKEEEAYHNKGTHKPRSPRRHNSPRHRSGSRRSRTPSPGRYNSPKKKGTRRSRTNNRTYDYEDDEKEMGVPCFTRRVRITPVPDGWHVVDDDYGQTVGKPQVESMMSTTASLFPQLETKVYRSGEEQIVRLKVMLASFTTAPDNLYGASSKLCFARSNVEPAHNTTKYFVPNLR